MLGILLHLVFKKKGKIKWLSCYGAYGGGGMTRKIDFNNDIVEKTMHEHSRRGNMGLLVVLRFVATTDFDHVVFELGCKMNWENIVVERRKILVTHPSYGIGFVKRRANGVAHELARVAPLFPSLYSVDHVIPCTEHLIHGENDISTIQKKKKRSKESNSLPKV
ncbi:hypothetical protein GmHk_U059741 [Glycine max]|nr:hypothetical protein GmHk_U059741 [Glycine max]